MNTQFNVTDQELATANGGGDVAALGKKELGSAIGATLPIEVKGVLSSEFVRQERERQSFPKWMLQITDGPFSNGYFW